MKDETPVSKQYQKAWDAHTAAAQEFRRGKELYRARKVTDAEFCEARKAYDAVVAEFDAALEAEEKRNQS